MADAVATDNVDALDDRAKQVLRDNDRDGYTVPTSRLYPFQWNWDSAFVALGWAEFDRPRAWREIERLFEAQWPSGMVPHIIFWTEEDSYFPGPDFWRADRGPVASSGISQPPVVASIVRRLVETGTDNDRRRAARLLPAIDRWHRWWHAYRDPDGSGLISVIHPWESGRDNLPDWDQPLSAVDTSEVGNYQRRDLDIVDPDMRPHKRDYDQYLTLVKLGADLGWNDQTVAADSPFLVADPATSAILIRAERDLRWLLDRTGAGVDTGAVTERADRLAEGYEGFWSDDARAYCSLDLRSGERASVATSASFLAPYAGVTVHLDEICELFDDWSQHCTFVVPSFDPRHDDFEPDRYWRGPVWLMVNYMIATGLAECGRVALAEMIRESTRHLVMTSGFPESFNPVTGQPVGGTHFAWTAAMWLSWIRSGR